MRIDAHSYFLNSFFKARNAIDRFLHRLGWQLKGIFQLNDVEHYEDFSFSFYHRRNFHRLLKFSVPISLCDGNKSVELLHDFFSSSTRQAMIMNVIGRKVIKRWQILLWLQFRLLWESVSLVPGMKVISASWLVKKGFKVICNDYSTTYEVFTNGKKTSRNNSIITVGSSKAFWISKYYKVNFDFLLHLLSW